MVLPRFDYFLSELEKCLSIEDIQYVCDKEISYLKDSCSSPNAVRVQLSHYRNRVKTLELNDFNTFQDIVEGDIVKSHIALKFLILKRSENELIDQRAKKRISQDLINKGNNCFNAVEAIQKAISLLDSRSYISVVAGLYLLTGRRHTEIQVCGQFSTANFNNEELNDYERIFDSWLSNNINSLSFSGQLKAKKPVNPYNIPVLTDESLILEKINWLRKEHPQEYDERAKGSKELGLKVVKEYQKTGILPNPQGKRNGRIAPNNLRSAYFTICYRLFSASNPSQNLEESIFCQCLFRHELTETSLAYQDYSLNETQEKELIDLFC